jgi:hypothetical protein
MVATEHLGLGLRNAAINDPQCKVNTQDVAYRTWSIRHILRIKKRGKSAAKSFI